VRCENGISIADYSVKSLYVFETGRHKYKKIGEGT